MGCVNRNLFYSGLEDKDGFPRNIGPWLSRLTKPFVLSWGQIDIIWGTHVIKGMKVFGDCNFVAPAH